MTNAATPKTRAAKTPAGSRWSPKSNPARVWMVQELKPGGRVCWQEQGRALFGESYQHDFLRNCTRLPVDAGRDENGFSAWLEPGTFTSTGALA